MGERMEIKDFELLSNSRICKDTFRMTLSGCGPFKPGQFVNIRIDGKYLRRPISVCDYEDGRLTLIYKVVGDGTQALSSQKSGMVNLLYPLGNGYNLDKATKKTVLIGGGVGVPPLYFLAKELIKRGIKPSVILGFLDADSAFLYREFEELGLNVKVATNDGSMGTKGFVTDISTDGYDMLYCCGPEPMLRSVYKLPIDGEFSFEERMGCGFGACMGCSCKTVTGYKRICKEGPVLAKSEILW